MPRRTSKRAPRARRQPAPPTEPAAAPEPAPPATTSTSATEPDDLVLRTRGNLECRLSNAYQLFRLSRAWSSLVSNRQRFTSDSLKQLREQSREHLGRMGVTEDFLKAVADRGLVEVCIPYVAEERGWERRTMPWESVLSLATKEFRGDRHLCVIRHLERSSPVRPPPGPPDRVLLLASAPGRLGEVYSFDNELRLMASALLPDVPPDRLIHLQTPTEGGLREVVHERRPALLHLTGIDTHQGAVLLELERDDRRRDGFYLAGDEPEPRGVDAGRMAELVTDGGTLQPRLVAYNCYFSGSRLAAMAVAHGAEAAVGFQDTVDDGVAERFFTVLYTEWRRSGWTDLLQAFMTARTELAAVTRLLPSERQGGDVVLWTGRSLLAGVVPQPSPGAPGRTGEVVAPMAAPGAAPPPTAPPPTPAPPPAPSPASPAGDAAPPTGPPPIPGMRRPLVEIEVKPRQRLNYSLLHNDRSPFQTFLVRKFDAEILPCLEIDIQLHAGDTKIPFQATRRLRDMVTDLTCSEVRLPLVAGFFRQLRESVHTTLAVEVKCDGQSIHRDSYRVTLLPADEWTDDDADRQWLPSFVLPRDPVVQRIIEAAPDYLRALADDSSRGFDGYQRLAADGGDEGGVVDLQVRAIWSALLYETPLSYINPPPTYTPGAQRVRTPGQIFAGRHGTCLDLALLFAACLEYIGLMPVIFLIQGHAFPGYWRSEQAWSRWLGISSGNEGDELLQADQPAASNVPRRRKGWVFGREAFPEIVPLLNDGGLAPIETTELTKRGSFAGALDLGFRNLATGWNFDALIDLQSARTSSVTPLPLFDLAPNPSDRT